MLGTFPYLSVNVHRILLFWDMNNENLTRAFLQYVAKDERETIERALVGEDEKVVS